MAIKIEIFSRIHCHIIKKKKSRIVRVQIYNRKLKEKSNGHNRYDAYFCSCFCSLRNLENFDKQNKVLLLKGNVINVFAFNVGNNVFHSLFVKYYLFLIFASIVFDFYCTIILNGNMSSAEEKIKPSVWTQQAEVLIKKRYSLKGHMSILP